MSAAALVIGAGGLSDSEAFGTTAGEETAAGYGRINVVFILDGLRPDSINVEDTPNIHRLREQGVNFVNSHAVVPTVTRVNSASLSTGAHPGTHGVVGNSMYVPEVKSTGAFSTDDANNLLDLGEQAGRVTLSATLGEMLEERGKKVVTIGSGSSGSSLLLNPEAQNGSAGVMVNAEDPAKDTPLTFPSEVGEQILERFGPPPGKEGVENYNASVDYATQVLNDYLLGELEPDVVFFWMTEADHTQHDLGAGSPEAIETIRNDDRNLGEVLARLEKLELAPNVFVISDHGFSLTSFKVNLGQELIDAGLKSDPESDDVVVAETGSALIYVKDRDPESIQEIVSFLQQQEWASALYTAAVRPSNGQYEPPAGEDVGEIEQGWVEGTFSLELIHEANPERGADILVTFPWSSDPNEFGVPGTAYFASGDDPTGSQDGPASNHGSFSPWDVRNTFIASGLNFKNGATVHLPAGNVDIAPTLLALEGIDDGPSLDGRVLYEALHGGPDEEQVPTQTRMITTEASQGAYKAVIQVSEIGDRRYIDKSWLIP